MFFGNEGKVQHDGGRLRSGGVGVLVAVYLVYVGVSVESLGKAGKLGWREIWRLGQIISVFEWIGRWEWWR